MTTYDFTKLGDLLKSSGITIAEAAKIFKVSRPTMYSWVAGNVPTQELLLRNALRLIGILEMAVAARDLPVINVDRSERLKVIMAKLRIHLNRAS